MGHQHRYTDNSDTAHDAFFANSLVRSTSAGQMIQRVSGIPACPTTQAQPYPQRYGKPYIQRFRQCDLLYRPKID
jgi:hypothetical protein